MTDIQTIQAEIPQVLTMMREKLGIRAEKMSDAKAKARRRLPRRVFNEVRVLSDAEPFLDHPKLRQTLDVTVLSNAISALRNHLEHIDLADRRKGWWLGVLGGLSFNLIALIVVLIVVLVWRDFL